MSISHALPDDHDARVERAKLSLLGLSIGDGFGQQAFYSTDFIRDRKLPPSPWTYTDDTAMACSVVATLKRWAGIDQDDLASRFADEHHADPYRGYGSMARQILISISQGADWRQVSRSAFGGEGSMGNGGAMRVAPVGAYFADDYEAAAENARLSAEVTHSHPDGQAGAVAVAVAAAFAFRQSQSGRIAISTELIKTAWRFTPAGPTRDGLQRALTLPLDADVRTAVDLLGNGSRIISSDTVPFCLWSAARSLDSYEEAMWQTVSALGDRDTTCAIVGGIVALAVGESGVPETWRLSRERI